jgi:hypothetical protein
MCVFISSTFRDVYAERQCRNGTGSELAPRKTLDER